MNKICAFAGASGVGKSTLLREIDKWEDWKTVELSARNYLPTDKDHTTSNVEQQWAISYGNCMKYLQNVGAYKGSKNLFFSRSPLNKLAYCQQKHPEQTMLLQLLKEEVKLLAPAMLIFYIPIEFPMKDIGDVVRGTNEQHRIETDKILVDLLSSFANLNVVIIKGTVEERLQQIKDKLNEEC